jgi:hypothetical protein
MNNSAGYLTPLIEQGFSCLLRRYGYKIDAGGDIFRLL